MIGYGRFRHHPAISTPPWEAERKKVHQRAVDFLFGWKMKRVKLTDEAQKQLQKSIPTTIPCNYINVDDDEEDERVVATKDYEEDDAFACEADESEKDDEEEENSEEHISMTRL